MTVHSFSTQYKTEQWHQAILWATQCSGAARPVMSTEMDGRTLILSGYTQGLLGHLLGDDLKMLHVCKK